MEKNGRRNGLLSEHYPHYLWKEAAKNDRQMKRLVRRLDNLEKTAEHPDDEEYIMKKRMYSVGISYYASRSEYCYCKAELEFRKQKKQSM